jgi:hypothetical protein
MRRKLNSGLLQQQQQQQRESIRGGCSEYNKTFLWGGSDDNKNFMRGGAGRSIFIIFFFFLSFWLTFPILDKSHRERWRQL